VHQLQVLLIQPTCSVAIELNKLLHLLGAGIHIVYRWFDIYKFKWNIVNVPTGTYAVTKLNHLRMYLISTSIINNAQPTSSLALAASN
jgi:hypothetical protein